MKETKNFLGKEIAKRPHKIARELVAYMLQENRFFTLEQLETKLSQTNTKSNLKTRIKRCLTNTPDKVNERDSEQSRIFSIPLQYKNIKVLEKEGKFKLEIVSGNVPEIREEDYTQEDLRNYMETKENSTIDVKEEFASWLLVNAPTSYSYYLGDSVNSVITRLDEIKSFFTSINFFQVNPAKVSELIQSIKFLFSTKERVKHPEFIEYDKFNSNGIPKAVMGKNNYLKFLRERFNLQKESKFTWVPTFEEISNFLIDKKDNQIELIQLLKDVGCKIFNDQDSEKNIIDLEVIDPFTFYCYLNKYFKQRIKIIQNLADKINLTKPMDDCGIPSTNPQMVWLFPYKYQRNNNEINRLWDFFYSLKKEEITETQFQDILTIRGVGKPKLTEVLFYVNPKKYFPINGPTKEYLKEVLKINTSFESYSDYLQILEELKDKTNKPFYEISYDAWIFDKEDNKEVDFYQFLNEFNLEDLKVYFNFLFRLLNKFDLKEGDVRLHFSTKKNRLALTIGQRYSWVLYKKHNSGKFGVLSIAALNTTSREFTGNAPYPYYTHFDNIGFSESDLESIFDGFRQELERTSKSGFRKHNNENFEKAVFDENFRKKYLQEKNTNEMESPLNQIFFGPPGTGKTYGTIAKAIEIVDPEYFKEHKNERKKLVKRYQQLLITDWKETNGQIAFCTFHQSFTYEDFVEGIKPKTTSNKEVYYDIEPGIFKRICELADSSKSTAKVKSQGTVSWTEQEFRQAYFFKLSLGEANNPEDREIYEYCKENGYISIGFAGAHDLTNKSETEIKKLCEEINEQTSAGSQLSTFIHGLSVGDYVLISKGNFYVRALGKVVSDYEYHDDFPIGYNHFRKVEWVFTDENIPIEELYHTTLMQRSIYRIDHDKLKKEFFVQDFSEEREDSKNVKPYVLVIDEINRGNVASIFGELITLIEPDKRADAEEELNVILPYSKEKFSVPDNVYIIGTMNTADRSVEALDSALRRRFSFYEIQANPARVDEVLGSKAKWNKVSLSEVLKTINKRISALIDRDHQIGHSYFLKLKKYQGDAFTNGLKKVFSENIIPLLQEYFFNDYVKIGMVLGEGFIISESNQDDLFAEFEESLEEDYTDSKEYKFVSLTNLSDNEFKEALNKLLKK